AVITTNAAAGTATLTTSVPAGSSLWAGTIQDNGVGQVAVTKAGGGTLVVTAANTYTGTTTIQAGTLELRGGSVGGPIAVAQNGTLALTNAWGSAATLANLLSGSGNLLVNGGGAVRLANASNAFSGTATVNYGTLVVNDPSVLPSGTAPIAVNWSSTFYSNGVGTATGGGGQLLLASGTGITVDRNMSLVGMGPSTMRAAGGNVRYGGALWSVGNNTVTGTITLSSATSTAIGTTFGNLTLAGPLQGSGRDLFFTSPFGSLNYPAGSGTGTIRGGYSTGGQIVVAGPILNSSGTVRVWTGGNTVTLSNTTSSFAAIEIGPAASPSDAARSSSRLRVASGLALNSGSAVTVLSNANDAGLLEVRTSAAGAASFQNVELNLAASSNLNVFVDHAIGGGEIGQTVRFGNLRAVATRLDFYGRNGYGVAFSGTGGELSLPADLTLANYTYFADIPLSVMNGTLLFDASVRMTSAGRLNVGTGGAARPYDMQITGNLYSAAGQTNYIEGSSGADSSGGRVLLTGTTSDFTQQAAIGRYTFEVKRMDILGTGGVQLNAGALVYSGTGETWSRRIDFNNTALIYANQTGGSLQPLIFTGTVTASGGYNSTIYLTGSNTLNNEIASSIPDNSVSFKRTLQKTGVGTWVLSGSNTFTGGVSVMGGALRLQDTLSGGVSRNVIADSNAVTFGQETVGSSNSTGANTAGGTLEYLGAASGTSWEVLGVLTPTSGAGRVVVTPGGAGGAAVLTFSSLGARSSPATLDIAAATSGTATFTTGPTLTNGVVGGWATYTGPSGAVDWLATSSGTIAAAYSGYTDILAASSGTGTNYRLASGAVTTSGTSAVNTLKMVGTSGVTTLTLSSTMTSTTGGILFDNSAGSATIAGSRLVFSGSEAILIAGGTGAAGNVLTISSTIGGAAQTASGSTSLVKSGAGTVVLSASNTYTGNTTINQGTIRLSGADATLGSIRTAGNLTTVRQGAVLDLNAAGPGASVTIGILQGSGTVTNSGGSSGTAAATVVIGLSGTSTGTGLFTGILADGGGRLNVTKSGSTGSLLYLTGSNTYTGATTLASGTLFVTALADIGQTSGIGRGDATNAATNAASLVFAGGALRYTGRDAVVSQFTQTPSVSIDRLFTMAGDGTIDSSGGFGGPPRTGNADNGRPNNATLIFRNTGTVAFSGAGARTLTLQGNSSGDNRIDLQLVDNPNGGFLGITKAGSGLWLLGNTANSYSGTTRISAGALQVGDDSSALTRTLSPNSNVLMNGTGVLQSSGRFTRDVGSGAGQVQLTGSGGFSSGTANLTVSLGDGTLAGGVPLVWSTGTFLNSNGTLFLNSPTSLGVVTLTNPIDLNNGSRTVYVNDNVNATTDYAVVSGVISGSGTLEKSGFGAAPVLRLSGASTFSGTARVSAGAVVVESIGGSGSATSNLGGPTATLLLGPSPSGSGSNATLIYIGAGETSNRRIELAGTGSPILRINSEGSGPLVLTNVALSTTETGAKQIALGGNYNGPNEITSNLSNGANALGLIIGDNSTWILSGSNNFNGTFPFGNSSATVIFGAGASLGIGHDFALGSATIDPVHVGSQTSYGSVRLFAANGPRIIANTIFTSTNATATTNSVIVDGTSSLTLAGTVDAARVTSWRNTMSSGAVLTFAGPVDFTNSLGSSAAGRLAIEGSGNTVVSGTLMPMGGKTMVLSLWGTGTMTVSGTNTAATGWSAIVSGSYANQPGGTLVFTSSAAIPGTSGGVLSFGAKDTIAAGYPIDQNFL
ncbi:MAG: hypothetical protein EBZ59_07845, partial [Planctomycetia bacterium]|nr:hypothetical protein [Planctomycetia bacterium]